MGTEHTCPACGRKLAGDAPQGLCPECLIKAGFPTDAIPQAGDATSPLAFKPPSVAEIARLFPHLEILELVGRGGMGAVYRARQPALDRCVAIKILPPQASQKAGFAGRFAREARALARLNHPNIVAVHEFGEAGGMPYFLMEFVDGPTLRQLVQQRRLGAREALQIVPQICDALQYAHDEGVVHRDIKPENILIDRKGRVKIADFGIARIVSGDQVRQTFTENQVLGTPHYMAPEQIEQPQAVDHRADIYSLGVVFYEMLTGELPLGKFLPPSRKIVLDVRVDEIVLHALEKEPARRYQHASEVKSDVQTVAAGVQQANNPSVQNQPSAEPARDVLRQRTLWYGFITALAGLPVGIMLNLPYVWVLAICGIVITALKLGLPSNSRTPIATQQGPTVFYTSRHPFVARVALLIGCILLAIVVSLLLPNQGRSRAGGVNRSQVPAANGYNTTAADDVTSVIAQEKVAEQDPNKRFFLLGPALGAAPPRGYALLLVLPGGDGGPDFLTFIKRLYLHALPTDYLLAELVAPQWDPDQGNHLVWPTETARYPGMQFSTEAFAHAVIAEIEKQHPLDTRRVFTLSWSSGGPAGYAASLYPHTRITGSLIAMSVFQPQRLPDLKAARGQAYFLLHSPDDTLVPLVMATRARDWLTENGGRATLATYEGGHGWHGHVFDQIYAGIRWLEKQTAIENPASESTRNN